MMNRKITPSVLLLITLLTTNNLKSMQCPQDGTLTLQKISQNGPCQKPVEHISRSQLNPSSLTFESPYRFVTGGTKGVNTCIRDSKITINPTQYQKIKRSVLNKTNEFLYVEAQQKTSQKTYYYELKTQGIIIKK